jgi:hypothetical protein
MLPSPQQSGFFRERIWDIKYEKDDFDRILLDDAGG